MNFFKDRELAQRLRNNQVSEKEKLVYLLINLIVISLPSLFPASNTITVILHTALIIIGTIFCYKVNAKGDNQDYIARYMSLNIPILVQMIILMVLFFITLVFLSIKYPYIIINLENDKNIEVIINTLVFDCYFFWRLYGSIKIASGQ